MEAFDAHFRNNAFGMHSKSTCLSIAIFRGVLDGLTYIEAAKRYGLSHSAIEHRIKNLARLVHAEVGIAGVNLEAAAYVKKLRDSKSAVEAALVKFEELGRRLESAPEVLSDEQVQKVILRAAHRSPTALRDVALLHIVLSTGARPLEVSRFEVADYLNPDGTVRTRSELRPETSVNGKARPLFFNTAAAVRAIDAYLSLRSERQAKSARAMYRGFKPDDRLFVNDAGEPFVLVWEEQKGGRMLICRQLLDTYRRIFKRINMPGLTPTILRRTLAYRLLARGASEETIGLIMGLSRKKDIQKLLPPRFGPCELMANIYALDDAGSD